MTNPDELEALASKVEVLTGPNFAIETEIAYALDLPLEGLAKPYTASLDAAMTLVPEGLFPTMDFVAGRCWLRDEKGHDVPRGPAYACGGTMPLALTSASLRARALMTVQEEVRCNLGVGCDEAGVCYANAHGQPEQCGRQTSLPRPHPACQIWKECEVNIEEACAAILGNEQPTTSSAR